MFGGLFGSLVGKIAAVVISITGLTGGLAVTNTLPLFTPSNDNAEPGLQVPDLSRVPGVEGVPLSFPQIPVAQEAIEAGSVQDMAFASANQAIQNAAAAEVIARQAAEAARKCIEQVSSSVSALLAQVPAVTSAEQAQALVTQAQRIAENAQSCVQQATALGKSGVDQAHQAAALAEAALGELGGLNLTGESQGVVNGAQAAVGNATDKAGAASGMALGAFQQIATLSTDLMNQALQMQRSFEVTQDPSGTIPAPIGSFPVPTAPMPNPTELSTQWQQFAMSFANQAMDDWSTAKFSGPWSAGTR